MFRVEECVLGTVQRGRKENALLTDAQMKLKEEECVLGMEQRSSDAAVKDV